MYVRELVGVPETLLFLVPIDTVLLSDGICFLQFVVLSSENL